MSGPVEKNWYNAFTVFLDRRALIMLFLGLSAGVPYVLIFSSLSFWLGEAGIDKAAVTMFSWATLGYSFKFVWAPLIDEIPIPFLTKKLGRRRAWLLIAQCLIITAIVIMAMTNPALGQSALQQMAIGAVLLGFASATQDIVIDAYRIELAEIEMQTILSSTYNAGYRIGMIISGAGALYIAAGLGTMKGHYIYSAWQYTYLIMAVVMLIGIITTLCISEPASNRNRTSYQTTDYLRLVMVFMIVVIGFVVAFILIGHVLADFKPEDPFAAFLLKACCFVLAVLSAFIIGWLLVKLGAVNQQMAIETWITPIVDFFKRYGIKLALALLLLIGFYRISDIVAGMIANLFYQDMNFSKEEVATAVKVFGVIFTLVGGFIGGLFAQRFNIMKMMLVSAIFASATNLIFIGLVKSGKPTTDVTVTIANQQYTTTTDEVGYWKVTVPKNNLLQTDHIQTTVAYQDQSDTVQRMLPYLKQQQATAVQMHILPLTHDNVLTAQELDNAIIVEGQVLGLSKNQLNQNKTVKIQLNHQSFDSQLDEKGYFSLAIDAKHFKTNQDVHTSYQLDANHHIQATQHYSISTQSDTAKHGKALDNIIDPLPLITSDPATEQQVITGKVVKEYSTIWLYFAIIIDNLASGMVGAVFIAFLSSLTNVSFTAVQYAIFTSLMTLLPKVFGGYSGTIVNHIGYPKFFLMTTLIGIPVLLLVLWVTRLLTQHQQQ